MATTDPRQTTSPSPTPKTIDPPPDEQTTQLKDPEPGQPGHPNPRPQRPMPPELQKQLDQQKQAEQKKK